MTSSYSSKSYKPIRRIDIWRKWILAGVALLVSVSAIDFVLAYYGIAMELSGRGEAVFWVCLAGLVVIFLLRALARAAFQRYPRSAYLALISVVYLISVALIYLATNMLRDFGPAWVSYLSPVIWLQGSVAARADLLVQSGASWGASLDNFLPHSLLVGSMLWLGAFSFLLVWHAAAHLARKYGNTVYYWIITLLLSLFLAELSALYYRIDSGYPTFVIVSVLLILLLAALLYKRALQFWEQYPWSALPAGFITFFTILQGIISAQVRTLSDPLGNALAPVAVALRRYWAEINEALALSPPLTLGGELGAFLPYALLWGLLAWILAFCAVLTIQGMRKDLLTGLLRHWRWVAGFFVLLVALSFPAYLQFSLAPSPGSELVQLPALPDMYTTAPNALIEYNGALWGNYDDGIYRFDDDKAVWKKVSNGLPGIIFGEFHIFEDQLWFVKNAYGGDVGIYEYEPDADYWSKRMGDLPPAAEILDVVVWDDTLWTAITFSPEQISGMSPGIYRYNRRNGEWKPYMDGLDIPGGYVRLAVYENQLWAGTGGGIFVFDAATKLWQRNSDGLPENSALQRLSVAGNQLWGIYQDGVYRYDTNMAGWQKLGTEIFDLSPSTRIYVAQDEIWMNVSGQRIYRYAAETETWERDLLVSLSHSLYPFTTTDGRFLVDAGKYVFEYDRAWRSFSAGVPLGRVLYERANGELWNGYYRFNPVMSVWEAYNDGLINARAITKLQEYNGDLWAGIYQGGMYHYNANDDEWVASSAGLPSVPRIIDVIKNNGFLWCLIEDSGPYRYSPELDVWQRVVSGLPDAYAFATRADGSLWMRSPGGVYQHNQAQDIWDNRSAGLPDAIGVQKLIDTASGEFWLLPDNGVGIYRYAENGIWQPAFSDSLEAGTLISDMIEANQPDEIWIGLLAGGILRFDRDSQRWQPLDPALPDAAVVEHFIKTTDEQILAELSDGSIYAYADGGWHTLPITLPAQIDLIGGHTTSSGQRLLFTQGFLGDTSVYRYDSVANTVSKYDTNLPLATSITSFLPYEDELWLATGAGTPVGFIGFGIYRLDAETETWLPENNFVDLPVCVARDDDGMLVVDYRHEYPRRFSPNADEPVWQPSEFEMIPCDAVFQQVETQIGLPSKTRRLVTNDLAEDTLGLRYAEGYLWVSPEGFSWNPAAKLDVIPLGAEVDLVNRQATLWARSESASAIDAYTIPLSLQTRWDFTSFLFALGRDPQYWERVGALALVYLGYLAVIYAIAGQSNGIAARQFFTLEWETPDLLSSLLGRGEQSYTALRLRLHELAPLPHLICLLLPVGDTFASGDVVRDLQSRDLPLGKATVNAALEMLVSRGILRGKQDHYQIGSPQLMRVYQRTYPGIALAEALEAARVRDPAFAEAIRFFERAGFLIDKQAGSNLVLLPQTQIQRERLGERFLARILPGQALKASTVRRVADAVTGMFKEDADSLRGRKALVVIGESADMAASAQMYAYRWDAGFTVVPLTRARIRTALTADTCHQELDAVLSEYLAESPDLYDHKFPVRDEHYFGRVRDTEALLVYLNENQPLGIFAINKMGKTSFVNNLAERFADRAVARVDLQNLSKNAQAVFAAVIRSLISDIEAKWPEAEIPALNLTSALRGTGDWAQDFSGDMNALYEVLRSHAPNPRFVIFVDEIDRLIPGEDIDLVAGFAGYNDLLATLRGIQQLGLPLSFVAVGISPDINRKAQLAGLENAGFNLFKEYFLPPLSREECDQMVVTIGHQMGLEFRPEALEQIFAESGGHPFLARQLCSALWSSLRDQRAAGEKLSVGLPEITDAVSAYMHDDGKRSYHDQIWATRLTSDEQQVVERLAAAAGPQPLQRGEQKALRSLMQRHIIIEKDERYHIAFGLLRRWVRDEIFEIYED